MPLAYLDWAATARPEADIWQDAARVAAERYANPSSPHTAGRQFVQQVAAGEGP